MAAERVYHSDKLLQIYNTITYKITTVGRLSLCTTANHSTSISCSLFHAHLTFTVLCFPLNMMVSRTSQAGTTGWYINRRAVLFTSPTTTQDLKDLHVGLFYRECLAYRP